MNTKLIQERVEKVLREGHLISLGVVDENGPWVADVIYAADEDMNIYWMSDPDTRHSQAISHDKRVAGTITMSVKAGEKNLAIQVGGTAEKIEGDRPDIAQLYFTKRKKPVPPTEEDFLDGDSWYMLSPTQVFLIDEENFGFNRQIFK